MKSKNKQIVFFSTVIPAVMTQKMALEFRKKGYETILFTMCNRERFDEEFFSKAFDKIFCSNFQFSKADLKSPKYVAKHFPAFLKFIANMKLINPYVIIGLSGSRWQLMFAHKYFFKKYPFIYFPYDINSHLHDSKEHALKAGKKEFDINAEKYLFENSDGILHKGDPNELKPLKGRIFKELNLAPLQLTFFPYCADEFIIPLNKNKLSKKDKEIHLVYIGGFYYGDTMKKIISFLKETAKQKIHTHIYAHRQHISKEKDKEQVANAFKELENTKYFHIHKPLGAKEIIPEISKYDFGLFLSYTTSSENIEQTYCTGNKISTYLEAGIPCLQDENIIFTNKLITSLKVGISFNKENTKILKKTLNKLNKKQMEKNILKARQEDYNIKKHFPRLEKFIKQVVSKNKSQ